MFDLLDTESTQPTTRNSVRQSLSLLTGRERRRYWLLTVTQAVTGILDLVGVLLLGLIILGLLNPESSSGSSMPLTAELASQVANRPALWLTVAALLFLIKAVAYAWNLRAMTRFLARCQARAASEGAGALVRGGIAMVEARPSQEYAFAATQGYYQAVTSVLSSFSIVLADASLTLVIVMMLFVVNPEVTVVATLSFGTVGLISHRWLGRWSGRVGTSIRRGTVRAFQVLQESLGTYREVTVLRRQESRVTAISNALSSAADAQGENTFIFQAPKLVYEAALVAVGVGIAIWQIAVNPIDAALTTLAFFLIAASRMVPSLLRMNAQAASLRAAAAQSRPSVELSRYAITLDVDKATATGVSGRDAAEFEAAFEISNVSFTFPDADEPTFSGVSITGLPGQRIAIVGSTGSGKSTLADILLGIREPTQGAVRISGMAPNDCLDQWPGSVAYVPQLVGLTTGSIRDNIALGLPQGAFADDEMWSLLRELRLEDVAQRAGLGLDTPIGEHGVHLSGGQRQRLGLCRALLTKPELLVLDEATSSLDSETEEVIAQLLTQLRGSITIVAIAHRLTSIRDFDQYVLLADGTGHVAATLDELAVVNPAFARQLSLGRR